MHDMFMGHVMHGRIFGLIQSLLQSNPSFGSLGKLLTIHKIISKTILSALANAINACLS